MPETLLASLTPISYNIPIIHIQSAAMNLETTALVEELDAQSLLDSLGGTPATPDTATTQSTSHRQGITSSVEDRALALLGSGVTSDQVAAALGVTPARISQLLSEEEFSKKVAARRYENLQKHNLRDEKYDALEDRLLQKLDKSLPMMTKPRDIIDALTKVNGAKRRGQSAPQEVNNQQTVINLVLPTVVTEKFTTNIDNQVIRAGSQELLTMQSGNLLKQVEEAEAKRIEEFPHDPDTGAGATA